MKSKSRPQARSAKTKVPSKTLASSLDPRVVRWIMYGSLGAIVLFVLLVRIRLLGIPLERDEGEYALMGQLLLKGIPPYEAAYNMKLPGTYYLYAVLMALFGQTATGVHMGLLVVNLVSIAGLFLIGRRLAGDGLGLLSAALFSYLSLAPNYFGFAAHATHFNALFSILGFLWYLRYKDDGRRVDLLLGGLFFGLAFIMKQQAVFLLVFGFLAVALADWPRRKSMPAYMVTLASYGVMLILPYILVVLATLVTGTYDQFIHWTLEYAREYAGSKTWSEGMTSLNAYYNKLSNGMHLFWIAGIAGFGMLFIPEKLRPYRLPLLLYGLLSLACVVPGLYFRPHYFIVFLPALAILGAITLYSLGLLLQRFRIPAAGLVPYLLAVVILLSGISKHSQYLFTDAPAKICRDMFGASNPFVESEAIGKFIRDHSAPEDRIAVLGSEPQIYFYADRVPATGFIYAYPLMENQPYSQQMQLDMIREIEAAAPKFIVYVYSPLSWLRKDGSSMDIFDWHDNYKTAYNYVGVVDLNPRGPSVFKWRDEMIGYQTQFDNRLMIYERP